MNYDLGYRAMTARTKEKLTQESAAERLSDYLEDQGISRRESISWRTLSKYENGTPIPKDILLAMAAVYKDPELLWVFLFGEDEIGKRILPELKLYDVTAGINCLELVIYELPETILRFRKAAFERRLNGEVDELLGMLKMLLSVVASTTLAIEKEKAAPAKDRWKQLAYKIENKKEPLETAM